MNLLQDESIPINAVNNTIFFIFQVVLEGYTQT